MPDSYPVAILIDKNCPKNYRQILKVGYEIIGQFDLEKVAFDVIELYICLQKAGIIKLLNKENGGMPAIVCSRFLEISFQRENCKNAIILAKKNKKIIAKMPKSIRTVIKQRF